MPVVDAGVGDVDTPPPADLAVLSADAGEPDGATDLGQDVVPDAAPPPFDPTADYLALTQDVHMIDSGQAQPSRLVVWGPEAFPVVVDEATRPFVAAGRVGPGRVLLFGHEGYLSSVENQDGDADQLLQNGVEWIAAGRTGLRVGLEPGLESLGAELEGRGHTLSFGGPELLPGLDLYITSTYADVDDAAVSAYADFWARGGGVIAGGHAWWWSYSNPGRDPALDYPGDRWLRAAGLTITRDASVSAGLDAVTPEPPPACVNASVALDALMHHADGTAPLSDADLDICARAAAGAFTDLPLSFSGLYDRAAALDALVGPVVPTDASPIVPAERPLLRVAAAYEAKFDAEAPANQIAAHPAAADFPGDLPPDALIAPARALDLDATYAGRSDRYAFSAPGNPVWRTTGLYAGPGRPVHVTVGAGLDPAALSAAGIRIRIGVHTDTLWDADEWHRFPDINRVEDITGPAFDVASAFGGPIQVEVPVGANLGVLAAAFLFEGAYDMARYDAAADNAAGFLDAVGATPASWVEFGSDKIRFFLPYSVAVQAYEGDNTPAGLMAFWDAVVDAEADLATEPHARPRAEIVVCDRQISAGWMHSGYPIMAHLDSATDFANEGQLRSIGDWGAFHELGHNHQNLDWVLPGTEEGNVNLYSIYVMENVVGRPRDLAHEALVPAERAQRIQAYVDGGRNFERDWNVWTSLETYLQLQEFFGWAPFQEIFADYRQMTDADRPQDTAAQIDMWCVRSSHAVGYDLGPFYEAWGFPVGDAAKAEMATLPAWDEAPAVP